MFWVLGMIYCEKTGAYTWDGGWQTVGSVLTLTVEKSGLTGLSAAGLLSFPDGPAPGSPSPSALESAGSLSARVGSFAPHLGPSLHLPRRGLSSPERIIAFSSAHPSPRVRASWPDRWHAIPTDWAKVKPVLGLS